MSAFLDPIPATSLTTNDPILILATEAYGSDLLLLALFPDGELRVVGTSEVNADFRYNFNTGNWTNVSWGAGDDATDEEDDWGEGISGHVPDPDGISDGDQGDETDNRAGNMDASEGLDQ
jgi:hypothetical protein